MDFIIKSGSSNPFIPVPICSLQKQLEYYFSDENLKTDFFFRNKISNDPGGYIPISIFLNCKRVQNLGSSFTDILEAAKTSPILEVSDDNQQIRRLTTIPFPELVNGDGLLFQHEQINNKFSNIFNFTEEIIKVKEEIKEEAKEEIEDKPKRKKNPSIKPGYGFSEFKSTFNKHASENKIKEMWFKMSADSRRPYKKKEISKINKNQRESQKVILGKNFYKIPSGNPLRSGGSYLYYCKCGKRCQEEFNGEECSRCYWKDCKQKCRLSKIICIKCNTSHRLQEDSK